MSVFSVPSTKLFVFFPNYFSYSVGEFAEVFKGLYEDCSVAVKILKVRGSHCSFHFLYLHDGSC